MARWVALRTWARAEYGDDAPDERTLQRWARDGHLSPAAKKHGKAYYVRPETEYCRPVSGRPRRRTLTERINGTTSHAKPRQA